jgi:hypothetical protein
VYVSGVKKPRSFLEWVRTKYATELVAQMKGEYVMLVLETADGFRATIGALRSLGEGEGVSFHTFSLPKDRCVRLLLKNLGKRMPEAQIKGGAGDTAHPCAGRHATPIAAKGTGR